MLNSQQKGVGPKQLAVKHSYTGMIIIIIIQQLSSQQLYKQDSSVVHPVVYIQFNIVFLYPDTRCPGCITGNVTQSHYWTVGYTFIHAIIQLVGDGQLLDQCPVIQPAKFTHLCGTHVSYVYVMIKFSVNLIVL